MFAETDKNVIDQLNMVKNETNGSGTINRLQSTPSHEKSVPACLINLRPGFVDLSGNLLSAHPPVLPLPLQE